VDDTPEIIMALNKLRRMLLSTVQLLEVTLKSFMPVCRKCFYDKGLVDKCECENRA